jgi:hypothetical protein
VFLRGCRSDGLEAVVTSGILGTAGIGRRTSVPVVAVRVTLRRYTAAGRDARGGEVSSARSLPDRLVIPHPDRCRPGDPGYDEILRRHAAALAGGEPTYVDPATGYSVFTARFLWERGVCCETGCRHCPYLTR